MKWTIGWGTVPYCNMNCKFCYSKNVRSNDSILTLDDWIKFVSTNHDKIDNINYGTGENSICDDWYELISYISSNYPEIKQAVTSNGYISEQVESDPSKAKKFFSSIDEVDISLDFCNKEEHNAFRGQPKAFDWANNAIELCKEHGKNVTIVFIGTNDTVKESNLEGLFKIAEKYDVKLRMNVFRPTNGINELSKKFILSYKNMIDTLRWINQNHSVLSIDDALLSALLTDQGNLTEYDNSLRILHDGSITPSTYLISQEFRKHNIKEESVLSHITSGELGMEKYIPEKCKQCKYVDLCKGGVYDRRYLWYGTFKERDPYCPFNQKEVELPDFKIQLNKNEKVSSIHHGYLPTMFFKN